MRWSALLCAIWLFERASTAPRIRVLKPQYGEAMLRDSAEMAMLVERGLQNPLPNLTRGSSLVRPPQYGT